MNYMTIGFVMDTKCTHAFLSSREILHENNLALHFSMLTSSLTFLLFNLLILQTGGTLFVGSFQAMPSPLLSSVLSSPSSLRSSSSSPVFLFLLSAAVLLGHVAGAPKGYDYDSYDDGGYDPYNSLNVVKVNKVVDYYVSSLSISHK